MKRIENRIEEVLEDEAFEDGCDKCCTFLKKIKNSLMDYKSYLVQENTYIDEVYKKYKRTVFK